MHSETVVETIAISWYGYSCSRVHNCIYLSVYLTKNRWRTMLYPVIVWIAIRSMRTNSSILTSFHILSEWPLYFIWFQTKLFLYMSQRILRRVCYEVPIFRIYCPLMYDPQIILSSQYVLAIVWIWIKRGRSLWKNKRRTNKRSRIRWNIKLKETN